jgi:hypothetical protein
LVGMLVPPDGAILQAKLAGHTRGHRRVVKPQPGS